MYSTVVRQDGEKVTVKMETSHTHVEEEEPGVKRAFDHGHTSSIEIQSNMHTTEEEERGAQDMDYFDDPDILQQIRAQKQ